MRVPLSLTLAPLLLLLVSLQATVLVNAHDGSASQQDALLKQKAEADRLFASGDYGAASRAYSKAIGE
jgi:hypothetical protein